MRRPTALLALLAFIAGLWVGRSLSPRQLTQWVDREVLRVGPGQTRVITKVVPGPERRVEVPVIVERPGPERVVTVTRPVEVPVEVVRERWPQAITVRVGSVLDTEGVWRTPRYPELTIGQVSPGVYAVPLQEGWRFDTVRTETRLPPVSPPPTWHVEVRPVAGVLVAGGSGRAVIGVQIEAVRGHLVLQAAGGPGWGVLFVGHRF